MAKKRIYEIARQYNISSDALVRMLRELDHDVKSHMSVMDEKMILDVNMKFEQIKLAAREDQERKKQMVERAATKGEEKKAAAKSGKPYSKQATPPGKKDAGTGAPSDKKNDGDKGVDRGRRRRQKKNKKNKVDQKEVEASVRRTMADMDSGRSRRRYRRLYNHRFLFLHCRW